MPKRRQRTDKIQPTRTYSKAQEKRVADKFGGERTLNSGATPFQKGDVVLDKIMVECKTKVTPSESMSIKKEWLEKNEKEALFMGKEYSALAFNFGPGEKNYYIIDEYLFETLVGKLNNKDE
jgi:hypothetical protein